MRKTETLRDLLTELARSHDFEPKMLEQKVFDLWRKCLGKPFAMNTTPVSLTDGVLKIYAEYPSFIRELLFHKPRIIAELNAELGHPVLTDLRIELRPAEKTTPHHTEHAPAAPKTSKATEETPHANDVRTPTSRELEQIEQAIADVTDTDLRISLRQLFITQSEEKP